MANRQPISLQDRAINAGTSDASEEKPAPVQIEDEAIKRLTLDLPASLHRALKIRAMDDSTTMAKLVRGWIEERVS